MAWWSALVAFSAWIVGLSVVMLWELPRQEWAGIWAPGDSGLMARVERLEQALAPSTQAIPALPPSESLTTPSIAL